MHEFTTMYHYFKGITDESSEKSVVELKSMVVAKESNFPPTEECTYSEHYLEMKSSNESDSNNNDIHEEKNNAIANLSYLNVDYSDIESIDVVDAPGNFISMQPLMKRDAKDLINNLNSMKIKEEDEKEMTNELKITEENYYDSNELNKSTAADDFSNACTDVLENISQADSSSLTPSTSSIPSSNSDNQALQYGDYLTQPSNRPITGLFGDYMTHPSNRPVEQQQQTEIIMHHDYMNQSGHSPQKQEASHLRLYFKKKKSHSIVSLGSPTKSISSNGTLKRHDSDASSKKSVDDELLEIINDFKNNVFTINEVEELVSSWKNRHDVKKNFNEKQEQLQKMREEYEKIQQKMNENLKRPSPFERMKRMLFSRKHDKSVKQNQTNLPLDLTGNSNFRPNSTLSLHSASSTNSSSGRMSTSSQASVCDRDSGTHSDHEERRNHRNNINLKISQTDNLMDNYLIPPSNPRPVLSSPSIEDKRSLLSFSLSQNATLTSSSTDTSEHYILFPSNVPIYQSSRKCSENNNSFSTFKP